MNTSITRLTVAARSCNWPGRPPKKALVKARRLAERGMATAEYAVGILAAVALALVLMKVFNSSSFLTTISKFLSTIFSKVFSWLP